MYTRINDYAIELVDDWEPLYTTIYSLKLVKLGILKTYIKNNLANGFINSPKSPAGVPIFFDKKPDGSPRFYDYYQGFNNLTIKNWYLLLSVGKSLNWLGWAWRFT